MRVVLTPVPVGYGTTSRCLAIAVECRRRGHEVLFACSPDLHNQIRQSDFQVREIRDSKVDPKRPTPPAEQYTRQHSRRLLAGQLRDLLAIYGEFRPDVVVSSHATVVLVAAAAAGLPAASVFHPDVVAISSPGMLLGLLQEWLNLTLLTRRTRTQRPPPPAPLGDLSCIPSVPELIHWPWLLPPQVVLRKGEAVPVGALLTEHPDSLPDRAALRRELKVLEAGPVVYATVGGAVAREEYITQLVEGLSRAGVQAVVSVGRHLPEDTVQQLGRERVRVERFLPDDLLAMKAADALLWHGGHETMLKAVACGVPAVGVPFEYDQRSNVKALERAGAGIRIERDDLGAERVAQAIHRVLETPAYREAARRLAESNRRAGGAPRLVDLLEQCGRRAG